MGQAPVILYEFPGRLCIVPILSFLTFDFLLYFSLFRFLSFYGFSALFLFYMLSLELRKCSSDIFLSSRPRTGLTTAYVIGYGLDSIG